MKNLLGKYLESRGYCAVTIGECTIIPKTGNVRVYFRHRIDRGSHLNEAWYSFWQIAAWLHKYRNRG